MPFIEPDALGRLYRQHAPALSALRAAVARQRRRPRPRRFRPVGATVADAGTRAALAISSGPQRRPRRASGDQRRRAREGEFGASEVWFASVDDQLDAQEAVRCLGGLSLELREVIVARIWGGLTFDEIARLVGCSLPTAHRRYQAGLTELRERIDGRWTHNPPLPTT